MSIIFLKTFNQSVNYVSRTLILSISTTILLTVMAQQAVFAQSEALGNTDVNGIRVWHSPDKTRIVFDVSKDVAHTAFLLKNPERLVVDIKNSTQKSELPKLQDRNNHISTIRYAPRQSKVSRFVFELKKPLEFRSFVLMPNKLYGHRLVVDLLDSTPALPTADVSAQTHDIDVPAQIIKPQTFIVAIDAGHGGEDPGASGHRGGREKKITLSIAKRLKKIIDNDSRMQATLIRTGDYYLGLQRRRLMAREQGADIFVSIHADAFTKRSANGLSVFALSQSGATSAMARALAAKENASDLIGGVSLANKDAVLAKVLVDLSMTNTISESVNLGGRVLKELGKVGRLHSKRVEQANFAVLKSPDIPSILIEAGFITNLAEEKKLRSSSYQNKIAKAIHKALSEFYDQTPHYSNARYASPAIGGVSRSNTAASGQYATSYHRVKRGDSLSLIAHKYGMSLRELKRLNKLKRNTAVLGQRLKVINKRVRKKNPQKVNVASQRVTHHVVKRGDSLSLISAKYNVTIKALMRINGLKRNTVYLGQKIKLTSAVAPTRSVKPKVHKVKRGDTLSEIAEQYGVTIKQLVNANKMRSKTVFLGQRLRIPN